MSNFALESQLVAMLAESKMASISFKARSKRSPSPLVGEGAGG